MVANSSYDPLITDCPEAAFQVLIYGGRYDPGWLDPTNGTARPLTSDVTGNESNETAEVATAAQLRFPNLVHTVITCTLLGVVILATIIGNIFVIAAIVLERNLHNVANYLIASLAVADLMVAILVMPLAAVKEVSTTWFLGKEACDMFISSDVLCCTSSILHLVAISIDRYWAVTRMDYIHNRPVRLIIIMIGLSWGISTVISIPPLFGWRDLANNPEVTGKCLISQDWGYTVYSTLGAFYIPLVIMLIIYLNVYRAARGRIRKKHFRSQESSMSSSILVKKGSSCSRGLPKRSSCSTPPTVESPSTPSSILNTLPTNGLSTPPAVRTRDAGRKAEGGEGQGVTVSTSLIAATSGPLAYEFNGSHWADQADQNSTPLETSFRSAERRIREKKEQARERKAARTLAIITGSFVVCWLPFFILALIGPFCGKSCPMPDVLVTVIGWLGYFNSLLNPVIYTIFNPDFRSAFRKILFGSYHSRQSLSNKALTASIIATGSKRTAS